MPRKRLHVARRAAHLLHRPPCPHDERPTRVAAAKRALFGDQEGDLPGADIAGMSTTARLRAG